MTQKQPLVSVMIPCYNSANTLPLALASVLAQTYLNWECIVVDDGSRDSPAEVVAAIDHPRIRFHRFVQNRGRAAARQQALDMACGEYVCMLDADDWIYPWKLVRQVEVMEAHPELAVLSAGMSIIDTANEIIAVRLAGALDSKLTLLKPLSKPVMPPIAHAPSMIRSVIAKEHSYDEKFFIAEDVDFLLRILMKYPFGILSEVIYAYAESYSYSAKKMTASSQANRQMFERYRVSHPLTFLKLIASSHAKEQIYRLGSLFNFDGYLVKRRSQRPSEAQVMEFQWARQVVRQIDRTVFPGKLSAMDH